MQVTTRTVKWCCLAIITGGCGSPDLVSPRERGAPDLATLDSDVVRMPVDSSFHETERFAIRGTRNAAGGCRFTVFSDVPAGQVRRIRYAEVRKSTCDAILIARKDSYLGAMASGLVPSSASFSLSPGDARNDFAPSDPSMSSGSDVAYGSAGPTVGSVWIVATAIRAIAFNYETRDQVTLSYSKANGCIQTASARNYARWITKGDFGWNIEEFGYPAYSGDPCGTFTAYGYAKMLASIGNPGSSCGTFVQAYTRFDLWATVQVSDGHNYSGYGTDFYTGSCEVWPEVILGAS